MGVYVEFMWVGARFSENFKREVAEKKKIKTVVLSFNQEEYAALIWRKKHEFIFQNEMYDVLSSKQVNGLFVLTVKKDTKEKKWLNAWKNYFNESDSDDATANYTLIAFLKVPMKLESFDWDWEVKIGADTPWTVLKRMDYPSRFLESNTPPPEA